MTAIARSRRHRHRASECRSRAARITGLALIAGLTLCAASRAAEPAPEPDGYRLDDYRAPTPVTLRGAHVITTPQAEALWKAKGAVFIDVMPQPPRPRGLPKDTLWRERPRLDIPGSVWLPDTGYGALAPSMQAYFTEGLRKATDGDSDKPIVIYCQRDCWMSWNAAKRAVAVGYRNVIWYPDGTDGWTEAGLPVQQTLPQPRPAEER